MRRERFLLTFRVEVEQVDSIDEHREVVNHPNAATLALSLRSKSNLAQAAAAANQLPLFWMLYVVFSDKKIYSADINMKSYGKTIILDPYQVVIVKNFQESNSGYKLLSLIKAHQN